MKDFLATWIVFQLVIIGVASVQIENQIMDNSYSCKREKVPGWVGAVLPLSVFVPEMLEVSKYCDKQQLTPLSKGN